MHRHPPTFAAEKRRDPRFFLGAKMTEETMLKHGLKKGTDTHSRLQTCDCRIVRSCNFITICQSIADLS